MIIKVERKVQVLANICLYSSFNVEILSSECNHTEKEKNKWQFNLRLLLCEFITVLIRLVLNTVVHLD